MGAVIVEQPQDLCIAQRAGHCKIACFKPDLIDLEAYSGSHGDKAQAYGQRDRLKRSGCESISDSRI
jgi:hypothetical protein